MRTTKNLLTGWLLVSTVGCANLSDVRYERTQLARTRSAWRAVPDCAKEHCFPLDYRKGWQDGFYDVTTGGKGCPPVVAPECYWKPSQILENCGNRRNAYYSGWQDGAAHASRFPDTNTIRVWSSCECPLPSCQTCPEACGCPSEQCSGACGGHAAKLPPTSPEQSSEMIESTNAVDLPLPIEPSLTQVPAAQKEPMADAGLVMGSGLSVPVPTMTAATPAPPSAIRETAPLGFEEGGLIDGGNVVTVSSVETGATIAAKPSVMPQQFDPASAFETAKPSKAMTAATQSKPTIKVASQDQPKSTVVEAQPIELDAAASEGTVELATELQL